ncbi:MAG: hypothetical protein Q8K58_04170 [Acidimicrobiales bacterium]|nr:hypothetical protein [Acidimicrobiales bacterium]
MRLHWFVGLCSILVAAIGTTVVVADRLDDGAGAGDQVIDVPDGTVPPGASGAPGNPTTSTPTAPGGAVAPAAGQVRITGSLTALHLDGAVPQPRKVPTPLTLVSQRGFGNGGELTGVTVGGRDSAIVWDGGRPFVLSSGPALVLDPLPVDLTGEGLRLTLGGGVHAVARGAYRLNTPVAVGSAGVATPRDAVDFEAGAEARFEATGDTALVLGPTGPHRLTGPGSVHLEGQLAITDSSGATRSATVFDLADGPFDLVVTPEPGGTWSVVATAAA